MCEGTPDDIKMLLGAEQVDIDTLVASSVWKLPETSADEHDISVYAVIAVDPNSSGKLLLVTYNGIAAAQTGMVARPAQHTDPEYHE